MVSIKFFIYLSDVSTDNGCLSYILGAINCERSGKINFTKEIEYKNYWSLNSLVKFAEEKL